MSRQYIGRRTAVQVTFAGTDITDDIRPYLISLTYTDSEEDETDDLQIKLQDRDGLWGCQWLTDMIDAAAAPANKTAGNAAGSGQTGAGGNYVVTAQALRIRQGPGMKYPTLGYLKNGDTVQVSEINGAWATASHNGQTVYLGAKYLTRSANQPETAETEYYTVGEDGPKGGTAAAGEPYTVTAAKGLRVRAGPGTNYDKLDAYPKGTVVQVLSISGSWAKIDYNGREAWMNTAYLKAGGEAASAASSGTDSEKAAELAEERRKAAENTDLKIQAVIVRQNWNADGKDDYLDCGAFELDDIDVSGPPATVTIKGTSLPYRAKIRQTLNSQAWEAYPLSKIVREMAERNGLSWLYLSGTDPFYERVEQYRQSDIRFLQKLCHDAGISLKVTNDMLVLFDQAEYEAKDPVLTIRRATELKPGEPKYLSYKLSVETADTQYQSCRVSYTDPATGKVIEGLAYVDDYKEDDKDNQQLEITARVSSPGEAETLAKKRLRMHNKYAKTCSFTMPFDPSLAAGLTFRLEGWGAWDVKYIISEAKHNVGGSGSTTQIDGRAVLEGV